MIANCTLFQAQQNRGSFPFFLDSSAPPSLLELQREEQGKVNSICFFVLSSLKGSLAALPQCLRYAAVFPGSEMSLYAVLSLRLSFSVSHPLSHELPRGQKLWDKFGKLPLSVWPCIILGAGPFFPE